MAVVVELGWHYHWQWKFELQLVEMVVDFLSYFAKMNDGPRKLTLNWVQLTRAGLLVAVIETLVA